MLLRKLLGEILADMGIVSNQHLEEALARQRKVDFLINKPFHADYILQAVTNAEKFKAG